MSLMKCVASLVRQMKINRHVKINHKTAKHMRERWRMFKYRSYGSINFESQNLSSLKVLILDNVWRNEDKTRQFHSVYYSKLGCGKSQKLFKLAPLSRRESTLTYRKTFFARRAWKLVLISTLGPVENEAEFLIRFWIFLVLHGSRRPIDIVWTLLLLWYEINFNFCPKF